MKLLSVPLFAAALFAAPLHAETMNMNTMQDHAMPADSMPAGAMQGNMPGANAMSDAVVRKVDPAAGKITLKHGPIMNLDMPPMTMVFRVQPPELLNKVKAGDSVKFRAEDIGGNLTVTAIEKTQ
jgi:Cu/Ag efflux protein CusF